MAMDRHGVVDSDRQQSTNSTRANPKASNTNTYK
jgi:hypothetical protein